MECGLRRPAPAFQLPLGSDLSPLANVLRLEPVKGICCRVSASWKLSSWPSSCRPSSRSSSPCSNSSTRVSESVSTSGCGAQSCGCRCLEQPMYRKRSDTHLSQHHPPYTNSSTSCKSRRALPPRDALTTRPHSTRTHTTLAHTAPTSTRAAPRALSAHSHAGHHRRAPSLTRTPHARAEPTRTARSAQSPRTRRSHDRRTMTTRSRTIAARCSRIRRSRLRGLYRQHAPSSPR